MRRWLRAIGQTLRRRARAWLQARAPRRLPHVLGQRVIYALPTGFGLFFAVVLLTALLGALNYNNNLALMFVLLFAVIANLSVLVGFRQLDRLEIHALNADSVHAGEALPVRVLLVSGDRRPRDDLFLELGDTRVAARVAGAEPTEVILPLPTARRGWLTLGALKLWTEAPLGLVHLWTYVNPAPQVLIYPRLDPQAPPLPLAPHAGGHAGSSAGDEDLRSLRDYRPGDSMRRIAWKQGARNDTLLVRELEQPSRRELVLDWAATAGLPYEARISRLTTWCREAHRQRLRFALVLPRAELAMDAGPAHLERCLRALALLPAEGA